jgi:hypothetical protein
LEEGGEMMTTRLDEIVKIIMKEGFEYRCKNCDVVIGQTQFHENLRFMDDLCKKCKNKEYQMRVFDRKFRTLKDLYDFCKKHPEFEKEIEEIHDNLRNLQQDKKR